MRSSSTVTKPPSPELATALLGWYRLKRRPLPWRADRNPYRVWVAEVLLQQTRVAQAAPYFERFLDAFPTVDALARAPLGRVLKVWEGAGYYARGHHLHEAARRIVREYGGQLPATVSELEELPGVGPYIARAVAAIAFDRPEVALEANGLRVAARWTREEGDVVDRLVRARLESALLSILPPAHPGDFNEAVMELGETVCLPARPHCPVCPVSFACRAYRELEDPGRLPVRLAHGGRPHITGAVVVLSDRGRWLVQRRPPSGLLPGLWEFPGGKLEPGERPESAARRELREETGLSVRDLVHIGTVRHGYSHFTVELHVFSGRPGKGSGVRRSPDRRWVTRSEFARLPAPKATEKIVALLERRPDKASPDSGSRPGRTPVSAPPEARPRSPRAPR
ncbi:MAG TPA: A/G-specific adenine glycosylase [Thermoplasmata archaeon]|nr:A/G-specific adenine glycosylase [Thermoplasmata archaeon]